MLSRFIFITHLVSFIDVEAKTPTQTGASRHKFNYAEISHFLSPNLRMNPLFKTIIGSKYIKFSSLMQVRCFCYKQLYHAHEKTTYYCLLTFVVLATVCNSLIYALSSSCVSIVDAIEERHSRRVGRTTSGGTSDKGIHVNIRHGGVTLKAR